MTEYKLMRDFGENLQYLLEEANMSQSELAEESRLSTSTISCYIRGERMPTLKSIVNIAIALGCEYDELIDIYELVE